MAVQDENRTVNFELSVDPTKVEKGIDRAISALDKYDSALQKSAQKGKVSLTGDEFKSITSDINKTLSSFKNLSATLSALPQEYKNAFNPDTSGLTKVTQSINEVSKVTKSSAQIVKSDIESFTAPLRSVEVIIESLTQSLRKLGETANNINLNNQATSTETTWDRQEKSANKLYEAIAKLEKEMHDLGNVSVEELKRINDEVEAAFKEFESSTQEIERAQASMKKWQESFQGKGEVDEGFGLAGLASNPKVKAALVILQTIQKVFEKIASATEKVKSQIDKFKESFTKLGNSATTSSNALSGLGSVLGAAGLYSAFKGATTAAMEYIENLNLFTVVMGDSIDVAQDFIDRMSEMFGMNPSNLMRYAGNFYQLTDAIDMTSEASKVLSLSLTKAAVDMSSLFNVDIETVVNNLSSGMQGMSRAVRKYGIDIRQATLAQTGLNYGFTENISTTSEANRQALRFLTIMKQISNATKQQIKAFEDYTDADFQEMADNFGYSVAEIRSAFDDAMKGNLDSLKRLGILGNVVMGDFARNIETPANQLRIIKEQISQLATAVGNLFLPVMDAVLYRINGLIMALRILVSVITSLLGINTDIFGGDISSTLDDVEDGVGGIGDAAESAKKELDKLVAPFDELNILSEDVANNTSSAGGVGGFDLLDPNLEDAIKNMNLELENIRMKAMDIRDAILSWFGIEWDDELGKWVATVGGLLDNIRKAVEDSDFRRVGELIAEKLNEGIAWGMQVTSPATLGPKIKEWVGNFTDVLNGIVSTLNFTGIGITVGQLITDGLIGINTFLEKFEWNTLGNQIANFVKGAIAAIDWNLLGETVANAFNAKSSFREAFLSNFPWVPLGNSFGTAITEFFEKTDWEQMGRASGLKTNGIVKLIRGFFGTYKQGLISSSLAERFNAEVKEIDFVKIAQTASNGIRTFFSEIFNFSKNIDKGELAKSIFEFMANIDWVGIIADLVEFIRNALLGLAVALGSAIAGLLVGVVKGAIVAVADLVLGVLGGIYDGIALFVENVSDIEMDPNPFAEMAQDIHETFWGTLGDTEELALEAGSWARGVKEESQRGLEANGGFELLGVTTANNFYTGLKHESNLPQVFGNQVFKGIEDVLISKEQIKNLGINVSQKFGEGLNDETSATSATSSFASRIEEKVRESFVGKFETIGRNLTDGLLKGMNENISKLSEFTNQVTNKTKESLGVHSPSTVFESIGKFLTEGLLKGMKSNGTVIQDAYNSIISNMKKITDEFVLYFNTQWSNMTTRLKEYLTAQEYAVSQATVRMSNMYKSMSAESVTAIQTIISALDAIPRSITTVHTIITNNVTQSASSVNSAGTAAKTASSNTSAKIKMASGGVVTRPTYALIGEGAYDEAVIPLGNSPQIEELVTKISDAVSQNNNNNNQQTPIEVKVFIGDKEWDAFTYKSAQRGSKIVGAQPIRT